MKNKSVFMLVALAATVVAGSLPIASAQAAPEKANSGNDALDEVIVTAQRRQEDLQKVPIAVTSLSIQDLAASNVNSVQDVATLVSGFIGPGDNGMQSPHLRGIGSQVGSPGIENSVALYVDGTYIGATTPALFGLNYVQQIDVLKGPQGTLFGRNTTGGLVQITTWDPSEKAEAEGELGYANYSKASGSLYFNAPVSENVSTNLAIAASGQGDGWGKNVLTGKDVYKTDLSLTLRNKWKIRFGEATELKITADYEKIDETGTFAYRPVTGATTYVGPPPFFLPPGSLPPPGTAYTTTLTGWDVNSNSDQESNTKAYGLAARLSHDFGFATLSNALAYRRSKFDILHFDADKTPLEYFTVDWYNDNKQITDELQLASNNAGRVNWTVGAFYYHAVDDTHQLINWGALAPFLPGPPITPPIGQLQLVDTKDTITSKSYAAYGQADFKIASATTLTTGLRYSHDSHQLAGIDPAGLEQEVAEFNAHAERGEDPRFGRGTRALALAHADMQVKPNPVLGPVRQGPFFAIPLEAVSIGIPSAGLAGDVDARVLDWNDRPIPGLYVAGNSMAMLDLGIGYQSGLGNTRGMVFGYLAAKHAKSSGV